MLRIRWQWWLAAGVVLALALLAVPALAATPAQGAQQNAGAVCPLSDDQTQKATQAFDQMAHTFTTEPRCVNCHGAVNPFSADPEPTHTGGQFNKLFKPVPLADKALIALGVKSATDVVDEDATNQQCQSCHSGLEGWKLPPPGDVFKGQTAVHICKNQKDVFGNKLGSGPPRFAEHIAHDVFDVQFIGNAFFGNRGLNFRGITEYEDAEGVPGSFKLEPPKGVTHDELNRLAKQWADALGKKFQGDAECGCVAHHYALDVDETMVADRIISGAHATWNGSAQLQMPITFKDDGSFTASKDGQTTWVGTVQSQVGSCRWDMTGQVLAVSLEGSVADSDMNVPGTMHIRVSSHADSVTAGGICRFTGQGELSLPSTTPPIDVPVFSMPDIPAVVGKTSTNRKISTAGGGTFTLNITIRQLD